MVHKMTLWDDPFNSIKSGMKTVEMRLNDEKRQSINVGDTLSFTNVKTNQVINVLVIEKVVYKDFYELYKHYDKISIGYKEDEIADPKDMLMYYSQEKIDKYGALAIKIKLIK